MTQELISQLERDIRRLSTAAAGLAGAADGFLRALDQLKASVREIKSQASASSDDD